MTNIKTEQSNKIKELTWKFEATSNIAVNSSNKVMLLEETVRKLSSAIEQLKKKDWFEWDPEVPTALELVSTKTRAILTTSSTSRSPSSIILPPDQSILSLLTWSSSTVGVRED